MVRCGRCRKPLTLKESIERGLGAVCAAKEQSRLQKINEANELLDFPLSVAVSLRYDENTHTYKTNVPHLVVQHGSDFSWGFEGSGCAELALNIIEFYLRRDNYKGETTELFEGSCFTLAWELHQRFKREFISTINQEGCCSIPALWIQNWIQRHTYKQLELPI